MIDGIEFSARGSRLTRFERQLLTCTRSRAAWVQVAQRLVVALGPDAGAQAFALVLDELGGERVYVPERRAFFVGLWRDDRDAMILDLASRGPGAWSKTDIANALGVSRQYVGKVLARHPRGPQVAGRP